MRSPGSPRISRTENPLLPGSWEPGRFGLADALTINPQEGLESFNHVEGLAPSDDVIEALKTPRD